MVSKMLSSGIVMLSKSLWSCIRKDWGTLKTGFVRIRIFVNTLYIFDIRQFELKLFHSSWMISGLIVLTSWCTVRTTRLGLSRLCQLFNLPCLLWPNLDRVSFSCKFWIFQLLHMGLPPAEDGQGANQTQDASPPCGQVKLGSTFSLAYWLSSTEGYMTSS